MRQLNDQERAELEGLARSQREPAIHVARARAILAVAQGESFTAAAHAAGRRSGDGVAKLVHRFNALGLAAIAGRPVPGRRPTYDERVRERILSEARRDPNPAKDGTATWSLATLQRALRRAPDGLPKISTHTIRAVLTQAGARFGRTRSWCPTGTALRQRKKRPRRSGGPRCRGEKKLIEEAYIEASKLGLALWTEAEAGPYRTAPYPGQSWYEGSQPACLPWSSPDKVYEPSAVA